jgi:hypothetical protein
MPELQQRIKPKNSLETKLTVSVSRRNAIRRRSLAGLVIAQRITRSIRFEEGTIDSEGRLHAFGSCCNDKLHTTAGKLPSDTFLWLTLGSIATSLTLKISGREKDALFVGQWAPTFLLLGAYNKLVKQLGSDRAERPI